MWYTDRVEQYCLDIDLISRTVLAVESELKSGNTDMADLREMVNQRVGESLRARCEASLEELQQYCHGAEYFMQQHGKEFPKVQAGRLFGFRPDKFQGEVTVEMQGSVLMVEFSDIQDFMHAKYAMRKGNFSQEDRTAGFYRVVHFDGYRIPVSASSKYLGSGLEFTENSNNGNTEIHEMTHFRNDVLGMNFYSQGGGRDTYEMLTYDDLQDEILAFFSEWLQRAKVQLAIIHDARYHFYRRMENWWEEERSRFFNDVQKYISIASSVRKLRPETYHVDLAVIPLHQWKRYLKYLEKGAMST